MVMVIVGVIASSMVMVLVMAASMVVVLVMGDIKYNP
jgi:hypothetical protein